MQIHELIPKVMAEIGAIGKDRKNVSQGYSFRGIDDLYNAVHDSLAKHGVFCVPTVIDQKREDRPSKSGGVLIYTILTIKYTFYAPDGSSFDSVVIGEGMDSGDKSGNKAMSGAQKYALLQVFCIPTEEAKDSENDSPEVKGKTTPAKKEDPKKDEKKTEPAIIDYEQLYEKITTASSVFELSARSKKYKASYDKCTPVEQETIREKKAEREKELKNKEATNG